MENVRAVVALSWALGGALTCVAASQAFDPLAFVRAELAKGSRVVRVPKGQYDVAPEGDAYLHLKDVSGVTVDFGGSLLRGTRQATMLRLEDCSDVTVANLAIDYPYDLPFTQGVIERRGPDGEWDVRIAEGYPDPANGRWRWPVQAYGGRTHELVNPMRYRDGLKVARVGERLWRVTGGGNRTGAVGDIAVWSMPGPGAHAVYATGCARCRFADVTVYATPGSNAFREMRGAGGNTYLRCRVEPCPAGLDARARALPRLRSGNHDAFNSRAMGKGPVYDGCVARNHCDDDVNINGGYWMVCAVEGARVRAITSDLYADAFVAGPVQVMLPDGTVPEACPEVTSFREAAPPAPPELAMLKARGLMPQLADAIHHAWTFAFADAGHGLVPGAVFVPQNAGGNGWTIRNCRFGPNRARALILNASHGLVENCVFDHTESQAVRASASYPWLEGGCCRDVTVRGCTFLDCDCYFGANLGNGRLLPVASHRDVTVEDNLFKGRSRLIVHGCKGLAMRGNTFKCAPSVAVDLKNVEQVPPMRQCRPPRDVQTSGLDGRSGKR